MKEQEKSRIPVTANEVKELIALTEKRINESEAKLSMAEHYIDMEEMELPIDKSLDSLNSFQILQTNQSKKSYTDTGRLKINLQQTSQFLNKFKISQRSDEKVFKESIMSGGDPLQQLTLINSLEQHN